MPKRVDHDERRRFVTGIAAELIAERGIDELRLRDVADAAGCSLAIVSHYFTDKRDLLLQTYRAAASRAGERVGAVLARDPADLHGVLDALLPLDAERRRDWLVWFSFWGRAVGDPELGQVQRDRVDSTERLLRQVLTASPATRSLTSVQTATEASRLVALVTGLAGLAVFDTEGWTVARQRAVLRRELQHLTAR